MDEDWDQLPTGLQNGIRVTSRKANTGSTGRRLEIGHEGTILGPAPPCRHGRIAVLFDETGRWDVLPHEITDWAGWTQPLAGGFQCGQKVRSIIEWQGVSIKLDIGDEGTVTGAVPGDDNSVRVEYIAKGGNVDHFPEQIVVEAEWDAALPGGFKRGQQVRAFADLRGETGNLKTGDRGVVVGPGSQAAEDWESKVRVYFGDGAWWTLWPEEIILESEFDDGDPASIAAKLEADYGEKFMRDLYAHLSKSIIMPEDFLRELYTGLSKTIIQPLPVEDVYAQRFCIESPHFKSNKDYIRQILDTVSHALQYGLDEYNDQIDQLIESQNGPDELYHQLCYITDNPDIFAGPDGQTEKVGAIMACLDRLTHPEEDKLSDISDEAVEDCFQTARVFLNSFQDDFLARMAFGERNLLHIQRVFRYAIKVRGSNINNAEETRDEV